MIPRHEMILKLLDRDGKISVSVLSEAFDVAPATIRRDLTILESLYRVKRIHGGAVKVSFVTEEPAITERRNLYITEKMKIAALAARLVPDNATVFLDIGTTVAQMVPMILNKRNLTVITNALDVVLKLTQAINENHFSGRVIFLGGELNAKQQTVSGPYSLQMIENFYADLAFIGVGGVHLSGGITGYDVHEVALSRLLIKQSREAIVLADHTKVGVRNAYQVAPCRDVSRIICDVKCPEEWRKELENYDVEWIS